MRQPSCITYLPQKGSKLNTSEEFRLYCTVISKQETTKIQEKNENTRNNTMPNDKVCILYNALLRQ